MGTYKRHPNKYRRELKPLDNQLFGHFKQLQGTYQCTGLSLIFEDMNGANSQETQYDFELFFVWQGFEQQIIKSFEHNATKARSPLLGNSSFVHQKCSRTAEYSLKSSKLC